MSPARACATSPKHATRTTNSLSRMTNSIVQFGAKGILPASQQKNERASLGPRRAAQNPQLPPYLRLTIVAPLATVEEKVFPVRLLDGVHQRLSRFKTWRTEGAFCKLGIRERKGGCEIACSLKEITRVVVAFL